METNTCEYCGIRDARFIYAVHRHCEPCFETIMAVRAIIESVKL
jgi:hypothetical protein